MDYFSQLPSGPLYDTLDFLSFPEIIKCTGLNKSIFDALYHETHLLFKVHLDREFPSYQPFQNLNNQECVEKLISFYRRDFKWQCLGSCEDISPRYLHRSAISPEGYIIFFGGGGIENKFFNDSWKVSFKTNNNDSNDDQLCFQQYTSSTMYPSRRGSSAMCIYEGYAFIFAGRAESGLFLNGLMALSVSTGQWSEVHPCSPRSSDSFPCPRWGHSVVEWQGLLVVFGGGEYGRTFNDLWVLDLKSLERYEEDSEKSWIMHRSWKQINPFTSDAQTHNQPLGRSGHACVVMEGRFLYMLGGNNLNVTFDDMWRIDLDDVARSYFQSDTVTPEVVLWERICTRLNSPAPGSRIGHAAVDIGSNRFVLYGGRNIHGECMISGTMIYDTRSNTWEAFDSISNHEIIKNRTGHCVLPTERGLLFIGGLCEGTGFTAEVISLDLFTHSSSFSTINNTVEEQKKSFFGLRNIVDSISSRLNIANDEKASIMSPPIRLVRGADIS